MNLLAIAALTLAPLPQEAPAEHATPGEVAAEVLRDLESIGYHFAVDAPEVVTMRRLDARKAEVKHLTLGLPAARAEGLLAWRHGMGAWDLDSWEDVERAIEREANAQRAAFYDPRERRVVVIEQKRRTELRDEILRHSLAHAFVHAWHDQDGGLLDRVEGGDPTTEEANLRQAVVEGEAEFVGNALQLMRDDHPLEALLDADEQEVLVNALGLDAWSIGVDSGRRYATARWDARGFGAVRDLWVERPSSTEQVLHPEKHGRDLPRAVTLPDWPADFPEAQLVADDVLGEMELYRVLRAQRIDASEARVAAAGWDGDRLRVFRTARGDRLAAWRTVWDREEDARQFFLASNRLGDGEWRLDGRVVDWAWCQDGPLASRWLGHASTHPVDGEEVADDAATTLAVEDAWRAKAALEPFDVDGRIVVPHAGFSVPLPEGFERFHELEQLAMWYSSEITDEPSGINAMSVMLPMEATIEELLADGAEVLEMIGLDAEELEWEPVGETGLVSLRAEMSQGGLTALSGSLLHIRGRRVTSLSYFHTGEDRSAFEETWSTIVEGVRFDAEEYDPLDAQPDEEDEFDSLPPGFGPASIESGELPRTNLRMQVSVRDGTDDTIVPDCDVWVIRRTWAEWDSSPMDTARRARERGRRFRTKLDGLVTVPYMPGSYYVYAARGARMGVAEVSAYGHDGGERADVVLVPVASPLVRVLDEDGEPAVDVPVAVISRVDGVWEEVVIERTDRRGEVEFEHVLSTVAEEGGDWNDVCVRLGFPVADPEFARIDPDALPDGPIEFTMPPTVEVVVRGGSRFVCLGAVEDPFGIAFSSPWSDATYGTYEQGTEELFTHVGLGVDLRVAEEFGFRSKEFPALEMSEDRVVLTVEEGDWSSDEGYFVPSSPRLSVALADEDGAPVASREVRWRVSYLRTGDGPLSRSTPGVTIAKGSTVTQPDGRVLLPVTLDDLRDAARRVPALGSVTVEEGTTTEYFPLLTLGVESWVEADDGSTLYWSDTFDCAPTMTGQGPACQPNVELRAPLEYLPVGTADAAGEPVEAAVSFVVVSPDGFEERFGATRTWHTGVGDLVVPDREDAGRLYVEARSPGWADVRVDVTEGLPQRVELRFAEELEEMTAEVRVLLPPGFLAEHPDPGSWPQFFAIPLRRPEGAHCAIRVEADGDALRVRFLGLNDTSYRFFVSADPFSRRSPEAVVARGDLPFGARQFDRAEPGKARVHLDDLDLSERLLVYRLECVDESGRPVTEELRANLVDSEGARWQVTMRGSSGALSGRAIADWLDVSVSVESGLSGFVRVREGGTRTVVLTSHVAAVLVPDGPLPELRPGEAIGVSLRRELGPGEYGRRPTTDVVLLEGDRAHVRVPKVGTYTLKWVVVVEGEDGKPRTRSVERPRDRPVIEIPGGVDEPEVAVPVPDAKRFERVLGWLRD